jgi:hypothetical protein
MVEGAEEGISQISEKQGGAAREFVWNFPLNVTYKVGGRLLLPGRLG